MNKISRVLAVSFKMAILEKLKFDNLALKTLPIDPITSNYLRTVNGACFSRVQPTPVKNPILVCYSSSALALLGIGEDQISRKEFVEYFSGNKLLPGSEPAAHCYCGHQFGYFSGQLGDGAAMYLGEIINKENERWEIQLKGAGLTPYSRQADGRKVLRSSIREFLCSEAMHFLGIPTTRAGTIITSDTKVIRDMFYDNNPKEENCAVVLRIAPTFLRFGSFEIFRTMDPLTGRVGPSCGRKDILKTMLDYSIQSFYPHIYSKPIDTEKKYEEFFKEVILRTAQLVAKWQAFGFCHGVLNTDNMSILGLTIDYGPFGFLDTYNPDHVSNTSDDGGRYSFSRQPEICHWNLKKFAEVLKPALPTFKSFPLLDLYGPEYENTYHDLMKKKLGLKKDIEEDNKLVQHLLEVMEKTGSDYTNCMRLLNFLPLPGIKEHPKRKEELLNLLCEQCLSLEDMQRNRVLNIDENQIKFLRTLKNSHPEVLEKLGKGNIQLDKELEKIEKSQKLKQMKPTEKIEQDRRLWGDWLESYSRRLKLDIEKDLDLQEQNQNRIILMNSVNPCFILRNHIAQTAIEKAEKGDFTEVQRVLKRLEHPFDDQSASKVSEPSGSVCPRFEKPPRWAYGLKLSCSS